MWSINQHTEGESVEYKSTHRRGECGVYINTQKGRVWSINQHTEGESMEYKSTHRMGECGV